MGNFSLAESALNIAGAKDKIIYDRYGLPSVMVYIPKFKVSDVISGGANTPHPAFIVNGTEIDGFWVSKYLNSRINDIPCSLPLSDPKTSGTMRNEVTRAADKGPGWHCMTRAEWAAIALWCLANSHLPKGNNNNGKDINDTEIQAIPAAYISGAVTRTLTGSGPLSWNHNGEESGIADMNGNVAEWQAGIRLVNGEVQILENNNAADPDNSQAAGSAQWKAINGNTGALMTPNGSGTTSNSVKIDYVNSQAKYRTSITSKTTTSRGCKFKEVLVDSGICSAAQALLQQLCLLPISGETYGDDQFWVRNGSPDILFSAGGWYNRQDNSGIFFVGADHVTNTGSSTVGSRCAYIETS